MRQEETFVGQPIRSLQTMLKTIAMCDGKCDTVVPDGIYGKETANAVSRFQNLHGLSPTGVADRDTWEAIAAEYESAVDEFEAASTVEVIMNPREIIEKEQYHPNILLTQAMLCLYADVFEIFLAPEVTGVLDSTTQQALESFQMLCGLPMTGTVDKTTWKHLASHFPIACAKKKNCFCKE